MRRGLSTGTPTARGRNGLWTVLTVLGHAVFLIFWVIDLHVLAPGFVLAFEEHKRPMTPFLHDVLEVYKFMVAHPFGVWATVCGVLLLDGIFYNYLLRHDDVALSRVWAILLGVIFLAVAALTFGTFWIARSDIWSTGYISP